MNPTFKKALAVKFREQHQNDVRLEFDQLVPGISRTFDNLAAAVPTSIEDIGFVPYVNVFDYMTAAQIADVQRRSLTLDMTNAINTASAACTGPIGPDGVTYTAKAVLFFPAGSYRCNGGLIYYGAPWRGEGSQSTLLSYRGSGIGIDARGADVNHRRTLNITGLTLDGTSATGSAKGLAIAHNYRSYDACHDLTVQQFPSFGLWWGGDNWILNFYGLSLIGNGRTSGSGMGDDAAVASPLFNVNFFALNLENNGTTGSGVPGGIYMAQNGRAQAWCFYGAEIESNKGTCEVRFTGGQVEFDGGYDESEAANLTDAFIFDSTVFTMKAMRMIAQTGLTGKGIRAINSAVGTVDTCFFNTFWGGGEVSAEDDAQVTMIGGSAITPVVGTTGQSRILIQRAGQQADLYGKMAVRSLLVKKTAIADNTNKDCIEITIPNGNHAAVLRVLICSSNGSTDAFESSRVAQGTVVFARTTGLNAVATVSTLVNDAIATVAGGATHTLSYALSSVIGAVGATNLFELRVTIDDSGNVGGNQVIIFAELINSEASGVTMTAS